MRTNLLLLFVLIHANAMAQWSPDPAINNPVCNYAGNQQNIQLVSDGGAGTFIIWQDTRNSSTDIYAQYISSTGVKLWAADGVAICNAAFNQINPKLVSDGAGGTIITWLDDRNGAGAGNYDIYAQRINASGVVQWTTGGELICNATGIQNAEQIISDGSGGAIIVWSDGRTGSPNADILAQRINSTGAVLWSPNGVSVCNASALQNIPQLISDGAGGAIITWEDWRNYSQTDIYAQRISSNGYNTWTYNVVIICSEGNYAQQYDTRIVSDGGGGALICWLDKRNFASNTDIYIQKVNSSGVAQWLSNGVAVCTADFIQLTQQMIPDGAGGAIITWEDRRNERDIYAQRINSTGAVQWTANGIIVCDASGIQEEPQLITRTSGGAILLWTDSRNTGQPDIYAQSIDLTGSPVWAVNGVPVSNESHGQFKAKLIADGTDGAIIAWEDVRSTTDYDIYGSRLFANGTLPIHLIDFTISNGINTVTLQWKTTNEINNSGYEIQRSSNGTDWSMLYFVIAKSSSGVPVNYTWDDMNPASDKSFYRLKQIDKEGGFSYSKVLSVNRISTVADIRIYPNPAREILQLNFGKNISTRKIQMYNAGGKMILTQSITTQASLQINVKQLAAGMYLLKIKLPESETVYKVIIE